MARRVFGVATVEAVLEGSPASRADIRPGDGILKIDGRPLRDVIDCYVLLEEPADHKLVITRNGKKIRRTIRTGVEAAGIDFASPVFGDVMTCNNRCVFCFVDQLPPGLRDTLYIKDDDYRLSFLQGNYITLTNLGPRDIDRILKNRLSPLYVSLHATDPELRRRIFQSQAANRALKVLEILLGGDISIHIQIVLVRGLNDGSRLDATLGDLKKHFKGISSVGVVPVGMSRCGSMSLRDSSGFDGASAASVLEKLESWRPSYGQAGPFAADEFFYLAGERPPPSDYYHGYPQLENGIGLVRIFTDGRSRGNLCWAPMGEARKTAVLTTTIGAWALGCLEIDGLKDRLVICDNSLFGERVTVCGLLPGRDVTSALAGSKNIDRALIPEVCLANDRFIDGVTPGDVSKLTGVDVVPVPVEADCLIEELELVNGDGR